MVHKNLCWLKSEKDPYRDSRENARHLQSTADGYPRVKTSSTGGYKDFSGKMGGDNLSKVKLVELVMGKINARSQLGLSKKIKEEKNC